MTSANIAHIKSGRLPHSERAELEAVIAQRTSQITQLAQHLQTIREEERGRLARELHDELGAILVSAKLDAARLQARLPENASQAQACLTHLIGKLNCGLALGRRISEDLRPSSLIHLGLTTTLDCLAKDFSRGSELTVHSDLQAMRLDEATELVIYRLVQEALTNVMKHAQARQVWIQLRQKQGQVHVSVRDDGQGFTIMPQAHSHGLTGMRFRVEGQGGSMKVTSLPEQGTLIYATLPHHPNATIPAANRPQGTRKTP